MSRFATFESLVLALALVAATAMHLLHIEGYIVAHHVAEILETRVHEGHLLPLHRH